MRTASPSAAVLWRTTSEGHLAAKAWV